MSALKLGMSYDMTKTVQECFRFNLIKMNGKLEMVVRGNHGSKKVSVESKMFNLVAALTCVPTKTVPMRNNLESRTVTVC